MQREGKSNLTVTIIAVSVTVAGVLIIVLIVVLVIVCIRRGQYGIHSAGMFLYTDRYLAVARFAESQYLIIQCAFNYVT